MEYKKSKDYTKYIINNNGIKLPKNRFVLQLVREYLKIKPTDFKNLKKIFKDEFPNTRLGVINELQIVNQKFAENKAKNYFIKDNEILVSADGVEFVVSKQWNINSIQNILKLAREKSFQVQEIEKK